MNHHSGNPIDDIDLAAAISARMHLDCTPNVTVGVEDGVVTLEGAVNTAQQREAAESVVRRFHVAGIVNEITLLPSNGT